eukprot:1352735-Pleurochrysis_carterae.AAC.1
MDAGTATDEQCTYAQLAHCDKEGLSGQALRNCHQYGSEGLHHHMCAVSTPHLAEKASAVCDSSSTLCAVCAGALTLAQVIMFCTDEAAGQHASKSSSKDEAFADSIDRVEVDGAVPELAEEQCAKKPVPSETLVHETGSSAA